MPSRPTTRRRGCCASCCYKIFIAGLSFLSTYLVYRLTTRSPRFYVSHLQVPPSSSGNLTFHLHIHNKAVFLGIFYDDLLLSARDAANVSRNASTTVPGFYQGHLKRAEVDGKISGEWALGRNATAVVAVGLEGAFRYKAVVLWRSRRYGVNISVNVEVDQDGKMTAEDWIQLHSGGSPPLVVGKVCLAVVAMAIVTSINL